MHMPGHKRNPVFGMPNPYSLDVTEVAGLDNLHFPEGIIRDFMDRMKRRYKTEETYVLVGGSTCGILAAVSACCRKGDVVIVDRGCHRSVYHAICLLGLKPVYLMPQIDGESGISLGISPTEAEQKIKRASGSTAPGRKPGAVILTSPTYEGVVSDVKAIAEIAHANDIPLIVDEAHGAHFPWAHGIVTGMPASVLSQGADIVVQSLHKTLPALTQTALLHLCSQRVPRQMVEQYLDIYETSSPSYVLMASAAQCVDFLEQHGEEEFNQYNIRLMNFYKEAARWQVLSLWQPKPAKLASTSGMDPSKLIICTGDSGLSGPQLGSKLRDSYNIEIEMETASYVLAMSSLADDAEGFSRLAKAVAEIDSQLAGKKKQSGGKQRIERSANYQKGDTGAFLTSEPIVCMEAYEAMYAPYEVMPLSESRERISAEYAMIYPPGVPFLVPGEKITEGVISQIDAARESGLMLTGLSDKEGRTVRVVKEENGE